MTGLGPILFRENTNNIQETANSLPSWDFETIELDSKMERWLAMDESNDDSYEDSMPALVSLSVSQRIAGLLSLLGGLYIFVRAWKRRQGAFDRIMIGLAVHTMLFGIYHMWGTAAIPEGTPGVHGAKGTTTTCSIQGFLFQLSMVVPFYYVFLSLYSWVVVLHSNFDPQKYEWIEKYIHVGVHIYPIASAIYLLTIESFNSNGLHCWIASVPDGCGDDSGIPCTRGPQNPHLVLWAFGGIPALFFLVFPTLVMLTLTYCVHRKQKTVQDPTVCVITATMVAKQSAIYLGSLYWVYLPIFVYHGLLYFHGERYFGVCLWVNLVTTSMGVWFAIVYWLFTMEQDYGDSGSDDDDDDHIRTKEHSNLTPTDLQNTVIAEEEEDKSETFENLTKQPSKRRSLSTNATKLMAGSNTTIGTARMSRRSSSRPSKRFSFNIFDGTASSGMFANFIFEGDSDDEEKDAAESKKWEHCQGMNNDR